jgi:oxygen-independent coproporphyrinogen-3 oxidase
MERYFERVVDSLGRAGYRWYETANFCLDAGRVDGRDLRSLHNLGYWRGHDYLGIGVGAVSTVSGERRRNAPSVSRYIAALHAGERPPAEYEVLDGETSERERLLLGLRLDEPLVLADVDDVLDRAALERMVAGGLVWLGSNGRGEEIGLTRRGRFLGGGVTAELLTD